MIRNDIKIRQRFGLNKSALERNQNPKIKKQAVTHIVAVILKISSYRQRGFRAKITHRAESHA